MLFSLQRLFREPNTSFLQSIIRPPSLSQTQPNPKKHNTISNSGQNSICHPHLHFSPKNRHPGCFPCPKPPPPKKKLVWGGWFGLPLTKNLGNDVTVRFGSQGTSWSLKIWIPCFPNQKLPVPIFQIHFARSRHYPPDKEGHRKRKQGILYIFWDLGFRVSFKVYTVYFWGG